MWTSARSPSRWLAPLALVACALAVALIVSNGLADNRSSTTTTTKSRPAGEHGSTAKQATATRKSSGGPRTYTVKPGDTLSAIAAKTGVPLARIEALNPTIDSQALQTGQTIKLRP
jgi:LysM repeat protein